MTKNSIWFEITLARRFLRENKAQTMLIIMGIAIGVAVMVFLSALIDGLQANLVKKTVGRSAHLIVCNTDYGASAANRIYEESSVYLQGDTQYTLRPIAEWRTVQSVLEADRRIETVLPVVEGSGVIRHGEFDQAIVLRGFDLRQGDRIYDISDSIIAGSKNTPDGAVLMGKDLAKDLGISAGDPIQLELSGREPLNILVDGVFDLGGSAANQRWLVMDQGRAAALLGMGDRVTSMEIQVKRVFEAEDLAREWEMHLPGYHIVSWQESNASMLSALRSQSISSYTIQVFVLLAVVLGVATVLAISAVQKSKQIGILKAMGIRTKSMARVFVFQGMSLGLLGILLGFGLGLAMSKAFIIFARQDYNLLMKPVPTTIIILATLIASTLSAYLPARKVALINPIEVIRSV